MKKTLIAALAGIVLLTGCASAEPEVPEATTAEPAAVEEAETPEPEPATVAQWASRVAESEGDVRDSFQEWEDMGCLPSDTEISCVIGVNTSGTYAEVLKLGLEGGLMEDVPASIGVPPQEIAALVDETIEVAKEASELQRKAYEECSDDTDECMLAGAAGWTAMNSLIRKLDAWKPYM